jgi:MYXO-CTERM domain-containing protein
MGPGRPLALAVGLVVAGFANEGAALVAPQRLQTGVQSASGVSVRTHRDVVASRTLTAGHRALATAIQARGTLWDADTGVLLRMWGAGTPTPGVQQSASIAASSARAHLDRHLAALAPGAAPSDLVPAGNLVSGGVRSVGFVQHYHGRRVLGGQVSFRYRADRLVMVASEALPHVRADLAAVPVSADVARTRAAAWIESDHATAVAGAVDGPFILPLVAPGRVRGYREVLRVEVATTAPIGRYHVYVDAATGAPVAREQTLRFASGTVAFNVPQRGPQNARLDFAAPFLSLLVNGQSAPSDAAGAVVIPDGPPALVNATPVGQFVRIQNDQGPVAVKDLSLAPGGIAVWNDVADEQIDAQLATYIHANIVKQRVRAVAPDFAYLDQQLTALVNIADICNAFSDGDQINFFLSGEGCENTGRISDVVYHEFGHSAHTQAIIEGVGLFEGALSEGISDYLASTITDDSGLARGFFVDTPNDPLRESNPPGDEWRWPEDLTGEVHDDGRIIAGALWDLRELLKAKLGPAAGIARTDHIWFESIRRAVDIPSMYPEALLADDDDGDLANGTPNECEINLAFHAHGLLGSGAISGSVTLGAQQQSGFPVDAVIVGGTTTCVDITPSSAELLVRVDGKADLILPMTPSDQGFSGFIPIQPDGTVVEYKVTIKLTDGSALDFPRNPADPLYQLYIGPVTPIFCSGFENPPELEGWNPQGFEFGPPQGQGGDPPAAFLGSGVAGLNLAGTYPPFADTFLGSPTVDASGFPTVRLQYRRWLTVEDGFFDRAEILANGATAWVNLLTDFGTTHHRDEEWRFHDIDLTPFVQNGQLDVAFTLFSDGGLELGGWNIDQLCIVGTDQAPANSCGDGVVTPEEACDDGPANSDSVPDACRTNCSQPRCGDVVIDSGEQCDDGNSTPGDGCSPACLLEPGGTTGVTTDVPTTGFDASDSESDASGSSGETDPGQDDDFADRPGCACDSDPGPAPLGLAALALLGLARRRRNR